MQKEELAKEAYRQILRAISDISDRYDIYCSPPRYIEIDEEKFFLEPEEELYG